MPSQVYSNTVLNVNFGKWRWVWGGEVGRGLPRRPLLAGRLATTAGDGRRLAVGGPWFEPWPGMLKLLSEGPVYPGRAKRGSGGLSRSAVYRCGPPVKRGSEPGLVTCTAFKAAGVRGLPGQVGSIPTHFRHLLRDWSGFRVSGTEFVAQVWPFAIASSQPPSPSGDDRAHSMGAKQACGSGRWKFTRCARLEFRARFKRRGLSHLKP